MTDWEIESIKNKYNTDWIVENIDNCDLKYLTRYVDVSIIEKYIDKDWDFDYLSKSKNFNLIYNNPDKPWNYRILNDKKFWVLRDLLPHKDWDYYNIYPAWYNFKELPDKNWNIKKLTRNINMRTFDIVIQYQEKDWDWNWLSNNINEIFDFPKMKYYYYIGYQERKLIYENFIERTVNQDWDWQILSENETLPLSVIKKHIFKNWDFEKLSNNKGLFDISELDFPIVIDILHMTKERGWNYKNLSFLLANHTHNTVILDIMSGYIENNIDLGWDFQELSELEEMGNIFVKHPYKNWNFSRICSLQYFNIYIIDKYPDLDWDWDVLSIPRFGAIFPITFEFYKRHINKPWWINKLAQTLSQNQNIDWQFVRENIDFNWNFYELSCNPNLDFDLVIDFPEKNWYIENITKNHINNLRRKFELKFNKEYEAIKIIERNWLIARYTPKYKICQRLQYDNYLAIQKTI